MAFIPPFKTGSTEAEQEFWDMFDQKAKTKYRMAKQMAETFWPTKDWNNLTDAQYEMITHYCNVLMHETYETLRQRHEGQDDYMDYI